MAEIRWKPLPMARRPLTAGGLPRSLLDAERERRRRALARAALVLALVALPACGLRLAPAAPEAAVNRAHEERRAAPAGEVVAPSGARLVTRVDEVTGAEVARGEVMRGAVRHVPRSRSRSGSRSS